MSFFGFEIPWTLLCLAAGAVGTLTIEHGWGWVLAKYHAYKAQAQAKATSAFDEVTSQVKAATSAIEGRVSSLETTVAAIKTKVGA